VKTIICTPLSLFCMHSQYTVIKAFSADTTHESPLRLRYSACAPPPRPPTWCAGAHHCRSPLPSTTYAAPPPMLIAAVSIKSVRHWAPITSTHSADGSVPCTHRTIVTVRKHERYRLKTIVSVAPAAHAASGTCRPGKV
jgi:hypothetical protein